MIRRAVRADLDVAIVGRRNGGEPARPPAPAQRSRVSASRSSSRRVERDYRVGESTVELASNYLVRRLALSRYLYEEQLPKNGLRYFFDDAAKRDPARAR